MMKLNDKSDAESLLISQTKILSTTDMSAARSWIMTALTMFPNNLKLQFEAYKLEKKSNNIQQAAKCFSSLNFQSQDSELWDEVSELSAALRAADSDMTAEQEFFVKMFQHVSKNVQHKILMLTVNNTENNLQQCKLLLLILKRFPQAAAAHTQRLLEMLADGMKQNPQTYQELLVEEVVPLIYNKTNIELPAGLMCRLFTISFEYYIRQIIDDDAKCDTNDIWRNIFIVLNFCAKLQSWEEFLPFNKARCQNVYRDKLFEIVATSSAGSTQVLFYATTLFIYSLHCYIRNCDTTLEDAEMNHVLVEGFSDWNVERNDAQNMEPPGISITTTTSKEISKAFLNAAQCWQLINSEQYQADFRKLMLVLPLAPWISRFLFDLSIYFGHKEEAKKLMAEMNVKSSLVQNIQLLSINLLKGGVLTLQGFECILKIFTELPATQGQILDHLTQDTRRHMLFIPLTQKALVQYCTKALVNSLAPKIYEPHCPDRIFGDLLVLLQLEYPSETLLINQIFAIITARRSFVYRLMPTYIINADYIEEFMYIFNMHNENFNFDFSQSAATSTQAVAHSARRIGTRGADKGVRDDFRLLIRQQIARAHENITNLIVNFINQEHLQLMQNIFSNETLSF